MNHWSTASFLAEERQRSLRRAATTARAARAARLRRGSNSSGLRPEPIVARLAGARPVDLPGSLSLADQPSR
jgi:hypothetical protein